MLKKSHEFLVSFGKMFVGIYHPIIAWFLFSKQSLYEWVADTIQSSFRRAIIVCFKCQIYDKMTKNELKICTYSLLFASRLRRFSSSTVMPFVLSHSCFSCSKARLRSSNSRICISNAWLFHWGKNKKKKKFGIKMWIFEPEAKCEKLLAGFFFSSMRVESATQIGLIFMYANDSIPSCVPRVVESIRLRSLWVFVFSLWLSFRILVPFRLPFSSSSCHVHVFLLPFEPMDSWTQNKNVKPLNLFCHWATATYCQYLTQKKK